MLCPDKDAGWEEDEDKEETALTADDRLDDDNKEGDQTESRRTGEGGFRPESRSMTMS